MVGWYHQLSGHEFEQTPRDGGGHGSLACYSPWGPKESDMTLGTEQQHEDHYTVQFQMVKMVHSVMCLFTQLKKKKLKKNTNPNKT